MITFFILITARDREVSFFFFCYPVLHQFHHWSLSAHVIIGEVEGDLND